MKGIDSVRKNAAHAGLGISADPDGQVGVPNYSFAPPWRREPHLRLRSVAPRSASSWVRCDSG